MSNRLPQSWTIMDTNVQRCFPNDLFLVRSTLNRWNEKINSYFYTWLYFLLRDWFHSVSFIFFFFCFVLQITCFSYYNLHFYTVPVSVIFTQGTHIARVPRRCMFAYRVCICISSPQPRGSLHTRYELRPNNRCRSAT